MTSKDAMTTTTATTAAATTTPTAAVIANALPSSSFSPPPPSSTCITTMHCQNGSGQCFNHQDHCYEQHDHHGRGSASGSKDKDNSFSSSSMWIYSMVRRRLVYWAAPMTGGRLRTLLGAFACLMAFAGLCFIALATRLRQQNFVIGSIDDGQQLDSSLVALAPHLNLKEEEEEAAAFQAFQAGSDRNGRRQQQNNQEELLRMMVPKEDQNQVDLDGDDFDAAIETATMVNRFFINRRSSMMVPPTAMSMPASLSPQYSFFGATTFPSLTSANKQQTMMANDGLIKLDNAVSVQAYLPPGIAAVITQIIGDSKDLVVASFAATTPMTLFATANYNNNESADHGNEDDADVEDVVVVSNSRGSGGSTTKHVVDTEGQNKATVELEQIFQDMLSVVEGTSTNSPEQVVIMFGYCTASKSCTLPTEVKAARLSMSIPSSWSHLYAIASPKSQASQQQQHRRSGLVGGGGGGDGGSVILLVLAQMEAFRTFDGSVVENFYTCQGMPGATMKKNVIEPSDPWTGPPQECLFASCICNQPPEQQQRYLVSKSILDKTACRLTEASIMKHLLILSNGAGAGGGAENPTDESAAAAAAAAAISSSNNFIDQIVELQRSQLEAVDAAFLEHSQFLECVGSPRPKVRPHLRKIEIEAAVTLTGFYASKGMPLMLEAGSLMGYYRNCSIMQPGDVDFDFTLPAEFLNRTFYNAAARIFDNGDVPTWRFADNSSTRMEHMFGNADHGVEVSYWYTTGRLLPPGTQLKEQQQRVDIFTLYRDPSAGYFYTQGSNFHAHQLHRWVRSSYVSLCSALQYLVPCEPGPYLESNYGSEWRNPKKADQFSSTNLIILQLKQPLWQKYVLSRTAEQINKDREIAQKLQQQQQQQKQQQPPSPPPSSKPTSSKKQYKRQQ